MKLYSEHFFKVLASVFEEKSDFTFEQHEHLYSVYKTRHIQKLFFKDGVCSTIRKDFPQKYSLTTMHQIAVLKKTFRTKSKFAASTLEKLKESRIKTNLAKEDTTEETYSQDFQIPAHLLEVKPYEVYEIYPENSTLKGESNNALALDITFSAHNFFIQLKEFSSENKLHAYLSGGTLSQKHKVDQALKNKKKTKDKQVESTESRLKNKRMYRKEVEELIRNLMFKNKNLIESATALVVTIKGNQEDRDNLVQPLVEHLITTYKTPLFVNLKTFKVFNGCKGRKRRNK